MTAGAALFLGFVLLQRLTELWIARRNTARLMASGAVEHGAAHYPYMVALHASWIAALVWFGHDAALRPGWLAVFAALQLLRIWILATLGRRWTTRIIVTGEPLVACGPFRLIPHPNYALVVAEIAVAPLVLGLVRVALLFSLLNAAMLWVRIRAENRALAPYRTG
ncbi:MAG: isoprenylcysteine carboxyl methyltransferase family protein [Limimaricola sp.]